MVAGGVLIFAAPLRVTFAMCHGIVPPGYVE